MPASREPQHDAVTFFICWLGLRVGERSL